MERNAMCSFVLISVLMTGSVQAAGGGPARTSAPMSLEIVVRTYALDAESTASPAALSVAETILGRAGVRVEWIPCGRGRNAPAECNSALSPNELTLRLARLGGESGSDVRALGYALISSQRRTGTMATVYLDRVHWLASESGTEDSVVLGRTIAHEIGHSLIGTNGHSPTGLMRALWTRKDFQRDRTDQWLFTPADVTAMRNVSCISAADGIAR
jgi:hypothetical protein